MDLDRVRSRVIAVAETLAGWLGLAAPSGRLNGALPDFLQSLGTNIDSAASPRAALERGEFRVHFQGYLISRPVPEEQLEALLAPETI